MLSFRCYLDNLAFMTRLAPSRIIPDENFGRLMAYMPAVGLTLGAVVVLPFALGLFGSAPWVQAWLMVMLSIYLTRGLHFDGVADVSDAVTTHTDPEKFWQVIKDSRSGAFGIVGLICVAVGQIILFHEMAAAGAYAAIAWAFVLGRTACVGFGYVVRHLTRPGLGKLHIDGASLPVVLGTTGATIVLGVFMAGPLPTIGAMLFTTAALYPLHKLAEHVKGANGDFLGCSILMGELAAGLGFALFI
ncbi:adenosylcobinamide-GDP ribazoletransferase [Pseudodesulfovibrio sp. zrk46]|uniref:adenosylcobinamide-GDP ribazoletransferase n=1 Tax=Pseudodesulfovibrio sp. zrk46 TaxID=2725288 RepID=UPI001448A61A|nr:adenosylcobinamide-GDP ribazoletransferase [Pseudodesulfovibrio sp. zrk46]QJB55483.1 adenosylcobinamide-GDP ribazoletransferase [Pseudodesulfovibrio sp. zrk46]